MDFFQVSTKEVRGGIVEVFPDFIVGRSKDIMVRGQSFYAIWDEKAGLWSTDEYAVPRLVDEIVYEHAEKLRAQGVVCNVKSLRLYSSNLQNQWRKFLKNISDNSHQLDAKLIFANTEVKKTDYATRRLPYPLEAGPHDAYDEIMSTLYDPEERAKLEWAVGAIVAGDSKNIQKFIALYGPPGSGKGTFLDMLKKLFPGYYTTFEAAGLVGGNNNFATEAFKDNPLIAIDPDSKMDKIEDNTKFNMITGHDELRLNEKFKPTYTTKINTFVFIGTNDPIKITDAKSGLIRRIIDVQPSGRLLPPDRYHLLMARIDFELGAIAQHCLEIYKSMGKNYYSEYTPQRMMRKTDVFYNYIDYYFDIFKSQDGVTLRQAYTMYKEYCEESEIKTKQPMYKFREELMNYFDEFHTRYNVEGVLAHSYYRGFKTQRFKAPVSTGSKKFALVLDKTESLLDEMYAGYPAQYGTSLETPKTKWEKVETVLGDLDTSKLHFVKVPSSHIVIDFDLKGDDGEKSLERNLEAASLWPETYAELSKSGKGVHLHYIYDGDPTLLANEFSEGIEIKVFNGGSSLRRKLTKCNDVAFHTLNTGLPFKEKKMLDAKTMQSEKTIREMIAKNLRKEYQPGTKPSIDFIKKILDDAYESGMPYDVSDLRSPIMAFATNSTNQALNCLKVVKQMKFQSETPSESSSADASPSEGRIVFFDVEVYPNLFVICWKYEDSDTVVRMINPSSTDVEDLFKFKLVGFNNRKYDNHILYARWMGYDNEQLYKLSQRIINNEAGACFGEAYNLSYTDIYDFATTKQGLKKWMIQLGMHHMEMEIPWDKPVPSEMWDKVVEYCVNDVLGTEAVFNACKQDFVARSIMAGLSGLSVNDTTRQHATRIIFGSDRKPQDEFNYTDLSKEFPGYVFDPYNKTEKSTYRGEVVGEGGYVYAEPGIYENVALLDVASMHPSSIEQLDLFGKYTKKFSDLKSARLEIKHAGEAFKVKDEARAKAHLQKAGKILGGIDINAKDSKALSNALKLVINSVYGYTSASFPNPFRDPRNVDNIVAKRGALFMIDLKHFVQERGFQVVHIKTDSIKIPNATDELIDEVMKFGEKYGYTFEHEKTFEKFCLVNDAVYIARVVEVDDDGNENRYWDAVGAQFQHPVVFKALFSGDAISFADLCETKSVSKGAMYLDFNEDAGTPNEPEKGMRFIGRTGLFLPVAKSAGGGKLVRVADGKTYAVAGTKGYYWLEADMEEVSRLSDFINSDPQTFEDIIENVGDGGTILGVIDVNYFENLANDAIEAIEKFGDYTEFVK